MTDTFIDLQSNMLWAVYKDCIYDCIVRVYCNITEEPIVK